jgi:hypothetical protein
MRDPPKAFEILLRPSIPQPQMETSSAMPDQKASAINIDPNGDVILELSHPDGKTHLLISSKVLSLASPVFAAMFRSRFKEGLGNHSMAESTYVIPLPEDDAEAFTLLCNVIHFRFDDIPRKPDLTCLEHLAFICDKYDCRRALTAQCALWLNIWIESRTALDWKKLLLVAYVLNVSDAFSRISWEILQAQVGPFVSLPGLTGHELVPHNLLGMSRSCEKNGVVLKPSEFQPNSGQEKPKLIWT